MLRNNMLTILSETWPMIFICAVILISSRLSYVIIHKKKFILYKELLSLASIVYMMCLFYIVTFQDANLISSSNYIPFSEIIRYLPYKRLFFKNILGNTIMFIPFGFFITYFIKVDKPKIILLITGLTSFTIEIIQKFIGRVFDIDDILLNLLGGFLGFALYMFLFKTREKLPHILKNNIVYNITIILFILILILYLCGFSWEWVI